MAEDEFVDEDLEFDEDEIVDEDIDPDELEEGLDEPAFDDDLDDVVLDLDEEEEAEEVPVRPLPKVETEDEDDDEDLVDPDDVEADLDTILKDRLVAADDEAEDDEDEVEVDDRGDPVDRIQPKRPGEFVCQSCFLVKHPTQLADDKRMLCRDCV